VEDSTRKVLSDARSDETSLSVVHCQNFHATPCSPENFPRRLVYYGSLNCLFIFLSLLHLLLHRVWFDAHPHGSKNSQRWVMGRKKHSEISHFFAVLSSQRGLLYGMFKKLSLWDCILKCLWSNQVPSPRSNKCGLWRWTWLYSHNSKNNNISLSGLSRMASIHSGTLWDRHWLYHSIEWICLADTIIQHNEFMNCVY
jgi:hypothetical protein